MLQYIIDAYKDKTGDDGFWDILKKSEKTYKICLVLIMLGFCTACISIFFKSVLFYILSVVFVGVVTLFYVCKSAKKRRKNWVKNIDTYDESLDELKNILSHEKIKYYSESKIKLLMRLCQESINELVEEKEKIRTDNNIFIQRIVLPIISFGAGILSKELSGIEIIGICIVALFFVVMINFSAKEISAFIEDIEGGLIEERKYLYEKLRDLLIRDFEVTNLDI